MKILIDISDQKYKWIVDNPQTYTDDLCEIIRNGTPLPEHHGRLIDLNDLYDFDRRKVEYAPTIIEGSDSE